MLGFLSFAFFVVGFALAYWFWIRPMLRARPQFADFYERTDSVWAAAKLKFDTIKTRLSAIVLMVSSALVSLHDFVMPVVTGIDWTPVTANTPPWVWPIASFAVGALFLWLRNITAKRQDEVVQMVAAGASPAQAAVMVPASEPVVDGD
jgi:hypothetical protein